MRTVVRARIDQATKDEAAAILGTIGLRSARTQRHHHCRDRGSPPR